jgi:small-conductance mechanosensitive channel
MTMLDHAWYGNTVLDWGMALALALMLTLAFGFLKRLVTRRLARYARRTKTIVDDVAAEIFADTRTLALVIVSAYLASLTLTLPAPISQVLSRILVVTLLAQTAMWANRFITLWLAKYAILKKDSDAAAVTTAEFLGFVGKVVLWVLALLLVLDNVGLDVTALVASLGIGGIAIALAVQNVLGDILASLSIALDKPFVIGDFIIVGEEMGTVEHIGLKTTRLRSLSGEQLIFSNADLLNSRIRNYKRMSQRRAVFTFSVVYQTPLEKLKRIPGMVRSIIETQAKARLDRVHFKDYGDSALNFEVVYYVNDPDYGVYMNVQQEINFALFALFQREGIDFAYPTRTLYLNQTVQAKANPAEAA